MIVSLILNLLNFGVTAFIMIWWFLICDHTGGLIEKKVQTFRFFTTDSNILCAVSSLVMAVYEIAVLTGHLEEVPLWAVLFKFVGTSAVMLTFLTVLFFLGPVSGYKALYARDGFHMHLVGPLLALVSFIVFESETKLPVPFFLLGAVPEILYAFVYLYKVVIVGEKKGGWPDFYFFNRNNRWQLSFLLMLAAGLVIGILLLFCYNLLAA